MGILPLEFMPGETSATLSLTGKETFTIPLSDILSVHSLLQVHVLRPTQQQFTFQAKTRVDTAVKYQ